jgi:hypothetical protein
VILVTGQLDPMLETHHDVLLTNRDRYYCCFKFRNIYKFGGGLLSTLYTLFGSIKAGNFLTSYAILTSQEGLLPTEMMIIITITILR